jgi:transcriptional regulator
MYNPASFRETDPAVLREAVRAWPLATLVTCGARGLEATHLPMLYSGDTLRGHIARANPQWHQVETGAEALAIFTGPEHYISPNWYPSKREHGRVVPTWNYVAVHVRGRIAFHDDVEWLRALVTELTDEHERGSAAPWRVTDAPLEYIDAQLKAIVGVEIAVTSVEGKWKLSQNRPDTDIEGVIDGLGGEAMGELMRRRKSKGPGRR